jgi:hypothetical protein
MVMDERSRDNASNVATHDAGSGAAEDGTLLPMLIGGLVFIIIGMIFVMWLA